VIFQILECKKNKNINVIVNRVNKKSYGELYNSTCIKENYIKNLGYNLVTIWESDKILQKKYKKRKNIKK